MATLSFPNRTRSYDATRRRVRCWAHDRALEISFFVEAEALNDLEPGSGSEEAELLTVFDARRDRIEAVAATAYARERKFAYTISAEDLH